MHDRSRVQKKHFFSHFEEIGFSSPSLERDHVFCLPIHWNIYFVPTFVNLKYGIEDVTLSKSILPKAGNSYKQDSVIIENN